MPLIRSDEVFADDRALFCTRLENLSTRRYLFCTRLESLSTRRYLFCTRGENLSTDRSIFCTGLEAMLAMKAYRLLCRAVRTNRCHSCSASGERSPLPRF